MFNGSISIQDGATDTSVTASADVENASYSSRRDKQLEYDVVVGVETPAIQNTQLVRETVDLVAMEASKRNVMKEYAGLDSLNSLLDLPMGGVAHINDLAHVQNAVIDFTGLRTKQKESIHCAECDARVWPFNTNPPQWDSRLPYNGEPEDDLLTQSPYGWWEWWSERFVGPGNGYGGGHYEHWTNNRPYIGWGETEPDPILLALQNGKKPAGFSPDRCALDIPALSPVGPQSSVGDSNAWLHGVYDVTGLPPGRYRMSVDYSFRDAQPPVPAVTTLDFYVGTTSANSGQNINILTEAEHTNKAWDDTGWSWSNAPKYPATEGWHTLSIEVDNPIYLGFYAYMYIQNAGGLSAKYTDRTMDEHKNDGERLYVRNVRVEPL